MLHNPAQDLDIDQGDGDGLNKITIHNWCLHGTIIIFPSVYIDGHLKAYIERRCND